MEIRNYEDGNEFIQRIDHILQRSVITELLMGFLPLEEWGGSFMLAVEERRPGGGGGGGSSISKRLLGGHKDPSGGGQQADVTVVVTAAVVAFIANVRVLLFEAPPGTLEPIVDFLLERNVKFPNNSVAGPARAVNEFCQLWATKTGYKYTSFREQRVYGIQELPRFPSKLKKPNVRLRKAIPSDASTVSQMYSAFLDEMRTSLPGGYKAIGPNDGGGIGQAKRVSTADTFIVNSFINEGKAYLLEDPSAGNNILSLLFVGDIKQDASAEISMIYTIPSRRRQGLASLLISEASKKMFDEGLCFIFVLEDPQVGTRNYKFFVEMGFRLEEFQTVCNLIDEASPNEKEGIEEEYFYTPEVSEYPSSQEWTDETPPTPNSVPSLPPVPSTAETPPKPLPVPPGRPPALPPRNDSAERSLPPALNKGPRPPVPSRASRRPSIPVPPTSQRPPLPRPPAHNRPPPGNGGRPLPRGPVNPLAQGGVASQKARFSVILSETIERNSVRGPRPPPIASSASSSTIPTQPAAPPTTSGSAVHSVRSTRAPGQPAPVLERFGGAIPVLPMPFGQPPMPNRQVPPRPDPQDESSGAGSPLNHPTKQRPMMQGRRLPTPQSPAQRQQRIQQSQPSDVSSSTTTQIHETAPELTTPEKVQISFTIPQTQTIQSRGKSYTVYLLQVLRNPPGESYTISRRYSQFLDFHKKITKRVSASLLPPFPGKKLFKNLSESVVEERRLKLLNYMNNLVAMPEVMALCSEDVEAFLQRASA